MTGKLLFRRQGAPEADVLRAWFEDLITQPRRGERARLRRAGTLDAVAMAPAFHRLLRDLDPGSADRGAESWLDVRELEALAALAGLASRLKIESLSAEPKDERLGSTLSKPREKSSSPSPRVSEARFRRLLTSDDLEQRFLVLRRLIALVERVNLEELAMALFDWTPERRRRLAYDYYANLPEKETAR